jgi:hypothetical protein
MRFYKEYVRKRVDLSRKYPNAAFFLIHAEGLFENSRFWVHYFGKVPGAPVLPGGRLNLCNKPARKLKNTSAA